MNHTSHPLLFGALWLIILSFPGHAQGPPEPWLQPPGFGGSRASNFDWNQLTETNQPAVADDFVCGAHRIVRVGWWGSYLPGYEPASGTNFFEDAYVLSFFLDRTNRPGVLVGTYIAPMAVVTVAPTSFTGPDGQRIFEYEVQLNQTCVNGQHLPDAEPAGFHGGEGRRYWFSVQAAVGRSFSATTNQSGAGQCLHEPTNKTATNNFWGWHTSPEGRASASVSGHVQGTGTNLLFPTASWQPNVPLFDEVDQAFHLLTDCDNTPPRIISVTGYCAAGIVKIVFDERLDYATGGDAFNYFIWRSNAMLQVSSAQLAPDQRSVWVMIDNNTPLPCGEPLVLEVGAVADVLCGNYAFTHQSFQCEPCREPLPGSCPSIRLEYERFGPFVSLSWNSTNYVLQSAPSPDGPWVLAVPTSPLVLLHGEGSTFYRLRCLNSQ